MIYFKIAISFNTEASIFKTEFEKLLIGHTACDAIP